MWPKTVDKKGKLRDFKYLGNGYPMHFCNPNKPRATVGEEDLRRVMQYLERQHGVANKGVGACTAGIMQVSLGAYKKQGTLQLLTTRQGEPEGNLRVCLHWG